MSESETFWKASKTSLSFGPPPFEWGPEAAYLLLGSCFAENLAETLEEHFLDFVVNPFGPLYNPLSLAAALDRLLSADRDANPGAGFFFHEGLWRHPLFHTKIADPDREAFAARMEQRLQSGRSALARADVLVITLGTAWAYFHRPDGRIWANCHRLPSREFDRRLLSLEEMHLSLGQSLDRVRSARPELKILLTLSPVRHLRDRAEENSLSKALLRVLCHRLAAEGRDYFPASEILLDELRDYRWYASDLVHPSAEAAGHIGRRFLERYGSARLKEFLKRSGEVRRGQNHRPAQPGSAGDRRFQESLRASIEVLRRDFPDVRSLSEFGFPS